MADDPQTWTGLSLEARHVPEPDETFDPAAHDVENPVTGFIDIGTVVDGVFVPLLRRKASGLVADIARAKKDGYTPPSQSAPAAQQQQGDTSALEDRIAALEAAQQSGSTDEGDQQQTPPDQSQQQQQQQQV